MIRKGQRPPSPSSSSEDDDDDFCAFSAKKRQRKTSFHGDDKSPSSSSNLAIVSKIATKPKSDTATVLEGKSENSPGTKSTATPANGKAESISSNKRHHAGSSAARAAKMDALLAELKADSTAAAKQTSGHYGPGGGAGAGSPGISSFVPNKKGSFVEEGEEHLTTNIFVGNLAPDVTEEQLTDLFRQIGDLYSVKIMWPRTAEERARNRNTGFVCFMTRIDAVEAMDAFQDGDPFGNGRNMVLRWGKNVKKTVKRGTGGVPIPPIARKKKENKAGQMKQDNIESLSETNCGLTTYEANNPSGVTSRGNEIMFGQKSDSKIINMHAASSVSGILNGASLSTTPHVIYDLKKHEADAIKVLVPSDLKRVHFISKVASFVAKDGSLLEKKLIEKEVGNHLFSFLTPFESGSSVGSRMLGASASSNGDLETRATSKLERTFYRWRVYSFCQGDGLNAWRTEPFRMFYPDGAWWIPPPKDQVAARLEQELIQKKEHEILTKKEERRKLNEKKDFMTGRQLEHAKFGSVPGEGVAPGDMAKINDWEREQLDGLIGKLCASRDSICEAMAFCFDKSAAAVQISKVLKKSLLESGKSVSIDTRIARLFLLSDVLFNSQQPGVRNAFRYRDAVEEMAPEVFLSLGKQGGTAGRMTMNKLRRAVTNILSAWSNWSVYNPGFLDGLQARFEGKEIIVNNDILPSPDDVGNTADEVQSKPDNENTDIASQIVVKPAEKRGGWTEAKVDSRNNQCNNDGESGGSINIDVDGEPLNDDDVDGEALDDGDIDVDGESLADDEMDELDGEPISDEEM